MASRLDGRSGGFYGDGMTDDAERPDREFFFVHEDLYEATVTWEDRDIDGFHVMVRWGCQVTAADAKTALSIFEGVVEQAFDGGVPEGAEVFPAMGDDFAAHDMPGDIELGSTRSDGQTGARKFFNLGAGGETVLWKVDGQEVEEGWDDGTMYPDA